MALSASGTYTFSNATTDKNTSVSHMHLDVNYDISPISGSTKYRVVLNLKLYDDYEFNWNGQSKCTVMVNGKSSEQTIKVPLKQANVASYAGPFTFDIDLGEGNDQPVYIYVYLDFTVTTCSICNVSNTGIGSTSIHSGSGKGAGHFVGIGGLFSDTVDVEPTVTKPSISNLRMNPDLKLKDGVSTRTDWIALAADDDKGNSTNWYYSLNNGAWTEFWYGVITDLPAGTSYNIRVKTSNSAGDSNILSITARTRYATPTISNLANSNKYGSSSGISNSTSSVSVSWSASNATTYYYKLSTSSSWSSTTSKSATISSLSAGTSYTVQVYAATPDDTTSTLSIAIRTRHNIPVVSLAYDSRGLETLKFNWSSDKALGSSYYNIDGGNWINLNQTGTTGSFAVSGFSPNTTHTIGFYGISTSTYDTLTSASKTASGTTFERATLAVKGDCIFGETLTITVTNPSGKAISVNAKATGNNKTPNYDFSLTAAAGDKTITFTQEQLDAIYKCYTNTNKVTLSYVITTTGESKTWDASAVTADLVLTGIVKTVYAGVNNKPRRGQMWYGVNNKPRRAILWVGDSNNKPRRCT